MEECLKNVPSYNAKIVRVGRLAEGASEELEKCLLKEVIADFYAFAFFGLKLRSHGSIAKILQEGHIFAK